MDDRIIESIITHTLMGARDMLEESAKQFRLDQCKESGHAVMCDLHAKNITNIITNRPKPLDPCPDCGLYTGQSQPAADVCMTCQTT